MGLFGMLGRFVGLGVGGTAVYGAGYAHKSTEIVGDYTEGIATAGKTAAEGFGAMLGAARSGFNSATPVHNQHPPTITHVYHDSSGSGKTSAVTIVVVGGGVSIVGYYVVCWLRGWNFFGMSQARTQEMINEVKQSAMEYYKKAQSDFNELRGVITKNTEEQARQADVLENVNDAVTASGARLADLDIKSDDIVQVLRRAELTSESMSRGMMAIQYFLASVAKGDVNDRDEAMRVLECSFKEQMAALPSSQLGAQSIEGNAPTPAPPSSSWSITNALQSGGQLVRAPFSALTSALWPSSKQPPAIGHNDVTQPAAPSPPPFSITEIPPSPPAAHAQPNAFSRQPSYPPPHTYAAQQQHSYTAQQTFHPVQPQAASYSSGAVYGRPVNAAANQPRSGGVTPRGTTALHVAEKHAAHGGWVDGGVSLGSRDDDSRYAQHSSSGTNGYSGGMSSSRGARFAAVVQEAVDHDALDQAAWAEDMGSRGIDGVPRTRARKDAPPKFF